MRCLLVILLLLILPFQATLAAVDLCCSYYGRGVRHQPCASEPAAMQPASDRAVDGSAVDIHCALCFLASVGLMPASAVPTLTVRIDRLPVANAAPSTWSSLHAPRPERPQWRAAA